MAIPNLGTISNTTGVEDFIQTNNTYDQLSTMVPDLVRKHWDMGCRFGERAADVWQQFEGSRPEDIIQTEHRPAAGKGATVVFKTMARFAKMGKMGSGLFLDPGDFERAVVNGFSVTVDYVRHAYSQEERMEEIAGMRDEIRRNIHELQGIWMGEKKSELTDLTMLLKATGNNTQFANGRTFASLTASDTISYGDILEARNTIRRYVKPANIKYRGKNAVKSYLFMSPCDALTDLELELVNSSIISEGDTRGEGNFTFSGGWLPMRGQTIIERDVVDEARLGPVGCPQAPKAYLGNAIAAGTDDVTIKGNWNANGAEETDTAPFRWFPMYSYVFRGSGSSIDQFNPASGSLDNNTWAKAPRYVKIINLTGANRLKWGFYEFDANNGETLTTSKRLAETTAGATALQTIGGVTWDSDVNTDAHPEGSLIIPCTENGVPYAATYVLGAGSLMRAYGKDRLKRTTEHHNGGFIEQRYVQSIFGQAPTYDVLGRMQGYRVLIHAIRYPDLEIRA